MIKMDLPLQDMTLTCGQCGQEFTFSAGEQRAYAQKGQPRPSQCAFCRAAHMMAGGGRGPSGNRGGRSDPGEHAAHREQSMYAAVCSQCGKRTTVPFEPRGDRPVYCSDCYQDQRRTSGGYSGGARGRRDYDRRK